MNPTDILKRLRDDSPTGFSARLAELTIDDLLGRKVKDLIRPGPHAERAHAWLSSWAAAKGTAERIDAAIDEGIAALEAHPERLGELLPHAVKKTVDGLPTATHYTPDKALLRKILDREPVRELLRDLLFDALVSFGEKLRSPVVDNPLARGLGGIGKMAKDRAKRGTLGALAAGAVGALQDEVERQVEKRASEFADQALSGVLNKLLDDLGNSSRKEQQAALRSALLEGFLDLTGREVGRELRRMDPKGGHERVRRGFVSWLEGAESKKHLEEALRRLVAAEGERSLGEALDAMHLRGPFRTHAVAIALELAHPIVHGAAFEAWLKELLTP